MAMMTLQRFGYDVYADQYKKDSNPVNCPMAIDFTMLNKIDYLVFCEEGDYLPDEKKLQQLIEYLRVTMLPWHYFGIDAEKDLVWKTKT